MNLSNKDWTWIKGHAKWLENDPTVTGLTYVRENFNDAEQVKTWELQGHSPRTGKMYDMRNINQPPLTQKLIDYAAREGLEHVGVSYYCMLAGDNLPYHSDVYTKYISLFNLEERKRNIVRYIFFPFDRKPGHILEIDGKIVDWKAGDWIAWKYNVPHLAANMGLAPRYSIQVTGVIREGL